MISSYCRSYLHSISPTRPNSARPRANLSRVESIKNRLDKESTKLQRGNKRRTYVDPISQPGDLVTSLRETGERILMPYPVRQRARNRWSTCRRSVQALGAQRILCGFKNNFSLKLIGYFFYSQITWKLHFIKTLK